MIFYILILYPLFLNLCSFEMNMDYFFSVNFVLGGVTLVLFANALEKFNKNDWKLFFGISIFSNIFTFFVEVIMLKFDVWGFNSYTRLIGITVCGAPIEEYIFWMYCPWLVGLCYISSARSGIDKSIPLELLLKIAKPLQAIEEKIKSATTDSNKYVNADVKEGQYARGAKIPTYLFVQLILISMFVYFRKFYHGSKKSMIYTTILFMCCMIPYEQYAIYKGFWTYNANKMLGIYFFHVPIEGWVMYILPPILGSMITDYCSQKFFKTDI